MACLTAASLVSKALALGAANMACPDNCVLKWLKRKSRGCSGIPCGERTTNLV